MPGLLLISTMAGAGLFMGSYLDILNFLYLFVLLTIVSVTHSLIAILQFGVKDKKTLKHQKESLILWYQDSFAL